MKRIILACAILLFAVAATYLTYVVASLGNRVDPTGFRLETFSDADAMITQLLITVFVVVAVGGATLAFVLPKFAQKVAEFTYDQTPQDFVAPTKLDAARSLILQGEYELAIEAFREFIEESEYQDRLAWVGIAQIEFEEFEDREAAIATLNEGWEHEDGNWDMDDDINFMFRLAELYQMKKEDEDFAAVLYKVVIKRYPRNDYQVTRAKNALQELGREYSSEDNDDDSSAENEGSEVKSSKGSDAKSVKSEDDGSKKGSDDGSKKSGDNESSKGSDGKSAKSEDDESKKDSDAKSTKSGDDESK